MAASNAAQPSVYLVIEGSAIAYDDSGEIVETVEFVDGLPVWADASICDHRGIGGAKGYNQLRTALEAAEANAAIVLDPKSIVRVASEFVRGA